MIMRIMKNRKDRAKPKKWKSIGENERDTGSGKQSKVRRGKRKPKKEREKTKVKSGKED
jgi:hypothetical protein